MFDLSIDIPGICLYDALLTGMNKLMAQALSAKWKCLKAALARCIYAPLMLLSKSKSQHLNTLIQTQQFIYRNTA